jgi:hypothetical protein
MDKRRKKHLDLSQLAASIVAEATAEEKPPEESTGKNQNAVALVHLGGLKGGPARKKSLSKKRRSQIAHKAARARWNKKQ